MKRISKKQIARADTWAKVCAIRDDLITRKYGFLMDEWTGKRIYGGVEHHHNDRDRSNNTLENCRTVSGKSHKHVTDNNVREVPDRLGLQPKERKAFDKIPALAGWPGGGLHTYSKAQQTGSKGA